MSLRQFHAAKYLPDYTNPSRNIRMILQLPGIPNWERCRSRTMLPSTADIKIYVYILFHTHRIFKSSKRLSCNTFPTVMKTQPWLGNLPKVTNQLFGQDWLRQSGFRYAMLSLPSMWVQMLTLLLSRGKCRSDKKRQLVKTVIKFLTFSQNSWNQK